MKFNPAVSIWLIRTEQDLKNKIQQGDMPFLGGYLDFLDQDSRRYFKNKCLNNRNPLQAFLIGLKDYPAVFATYLTISVVESYGQDGHAAVWPYIDRAIGSPSYRSGINTNDNKERLWKSYRTACIRIGLHVLSRRSGSQYMVNEFLNQAGVPLEYISHLVEGMVKYAKSYGLPNENDTHGIKQWRFGLLDHMSTIQKPVIRALETDDTDYFPRLFLRYVKGDQNTSNRLEKIFCDKLTEIQKNQQLTDKLFKTPKVVWRDENICIEIPASENVEWEVLVDNIRSKYIGLADSQVVTLGTEFPLHLDVRNLSDNQSWNFRLWDSDANNHFLLFYEQDSFIKSCSLADTIYHLEPGKYQVLSRFIPNGYDEYSIQEISISPNIYSFSVKLLPGKQTELSKGPATVILQADSKPILTWKGSHLKGVRGNELFASENLFIQLQIPEELREDSGNMFIQFHSNNTQDELKKSPVKIDQTNIIDITLEETCKEWNTGLIHLTASVFREGNKRSLVRSSIYLWNGLKTIKKPYYFEFENPPKNLNSDDSNNITLNENDLTFKDRNNRFFHTVFDLDNTKKGQISFTWAVPGTFLYLEEYTENGFVEKPLAKGSLVSIREGSRKVLKIFSDYSGKLVFAEFSQQYSFSSRSRYKRIPLLSLIDYIKPDSNTLYFQADDCNEPERLLHLTSPQFVKEFNTCKDALNYQVIFTLANYAEAIEVTAVNLITGKSQSNNVISNDPMNLLSAKNSMSLLNQSNLEGMAKHTLNIALSNWQPGAWLLNFKVKIGQRWYSLSNQRGDTYSAGFILSGGNLISIEMILPNLSSSTEADLLKCFQQAHKALLNCYAEESWESIKWIKQLWYELRDVLSSSNIQTRVELLRLSTKRPKEDTVSSWIPICSLGACFTEIYALSASQYHHLANESHLTLRSLNLMSSFSNNLTSLFMENIIHRIAAAGFSNFIDMQRGNEPQDFIIQHYKEALQEQNLTGRIRLLSQEDWQPSEGQYLGTLHYLYALKKMKESYLCTLGEDSISTHAGNHWRRGQALKLLKELSRYKIHDFVKGTPAHWTFKNTIQHLGLLKTEETNDSPQEVENLQLIIAGLSLLAQVCRWEARKTGVLEKFKSKSKQLITVDSEQLELILGYLLFIGEDIFSFYLLLWEFVIKADENLTSK